MYTCSLGKCSGQTTRSNEAYTHRESTFKMVVTVVTIYCDDVNDAHI